ncbi:hypothetical protein Dgeo_2976 (plasmid) [Deinococcus geothermalis DSM 11300]|uniref:Uncharacterized protein n=1 Tax=Deinococcus geothermalis (strain DSM 11300 / CIP 105573 / AG-3a) TaxID=319795 RepID=A8ZRB0_DEIGD|nr:MULTISPECIES: hypothetical protein [Deinococcus]ABW35019.1 hypothetical protein Dgeo_2976 [Deinococcus geothermalis DSM 11300]TDE84769.1 hypothetical protein E0686_15330 [Deinococcus sp. S9]
MHILLIVFLLLFGIGFWRGLLGQGVPLIRRGAVRPAQPHHDPLSPEALHRFHQVHGTPGW